MTVFHTYPQIGYREGIFCFSVVTLWRLLLIDYELNAMLTNAIDVLFLRTLQEAFLSTSSDRT
jgi:hypothetical protein